MQVLLLICLWAVVFSTSKVNGNPMDSVLEARQGISSSPFLSLMQNPRSGGQNGFPFLNQQSPIGGLGRMPGIGGIGGLGGMGGLGGIGGLGGLGGIGGLGGLGGMGGLGGLSGLPFNGLPLPGLLGPAGMQGLGGLQGSLGQDPSDLLRRFGFGLGNNGLGNGLGQLGLPHASPFTAVNPSLGRYMGDQQPFGDLFGLSNSPHRSIRRHLSTDQSDESNNDDKELAELLQAFNTLNGLPKDRSGARSGRVTHQQAPFLGVPSFRGLPHNGFLHRTGLESQSQAEKRPTSAGSNIFQYYQTPDTMARHKLQEVETDTDGYLTFPQSTLI